MAKQKTKPVKCRFCGKKAQDETLPTEDDGTFYFLSCSHDERTHFIEVQAKSETKAIERWNKIHD